MFDITIKKAENGYVLQWSEDLGSEGIITRHQAIEEDWTKELSEIFLTQSEEKIGFAKLVLALADYFGVRYDKYGPENLNIYFNKKGHKLE